MRRGCPFRLALGAQLFWTVSAFAQGGYKIEAIGAPSSSDLPQAIQETLQSQGTRLLDDRGKAVCEVWFRKTVPTKQNAGGPAEVLYGGLDTGTLVGVLRFPGQRADFRGQQIKAGFYTLRYALIPQDGNHMGVSPNRDFLLLSPAGLDADPSKGMGLEDLVKLSRQSSGTHHPGVLSMRPVDETVGQKFPALIRNDEAHWLLQEKLHGRSAGGGEDLDFPIALILVGKAEA